MLTLNLNTTSETFTTGLASLSEAVLPSLIQDDRHFVRLYTLQETGNLDAPLSIIATAGRTAKLGVGRATGVVGTPTPVAETLLTWQSASSSFVGWIHFERNLVASELGSLKSKPLILEVEITDGSARQSYQASVTLKAELLEGDFTGESESWSSESSHSSSSSKSSSSSSSSSSSRSNSSGSSLSSSSLSSNSSSSSSGGQSASSQSSPSSLSSNSSSSSSSNSSSSSSSNSSSHSSQSDNSSSSSTSLQFGGFAYTASGFGTSAYNGRYAPTGTYNGAGVYTNSNGKVLYRENDGDGVYWVLNPAIVFDFSFFYSSDNYDNAITDGWSTGSGSPPFGTFTSDNLSSSSSS